MSQSLDQPLVVAVMTETVIMGGAEMVVFQLCEELLSRGHTVHPVVPQGHEGWLLDQFRDAGIPWHTDDQRRAIDWSLPSRLAAMLRELDVDVAHSHEFAMAVYGTGAMRRLGKPHVITMHGNQTMTRKWRRRVALRWAFKRSHATVAVSTDTKAHLDETLGLSPHVVQVIQNGIPDRPGERDATRRMLDIGPEEVLLLSVGNLTRRKGHAVLVQALRRLEEHSDGPPWRLAIAGEGPERTNLEALISEAGLESRIHLLGQREDIPDLQAAADMFVMPSYWEGLPLAILEAMFAGNPIIASDISGIPEAVEEGRQGLLTPPGDVEALSDAIRQLLIQPGRRALFGKEARAKATERFTIAAMTDQYERLYRERPLGGSDAS